eukprot:4340295-Prymnesium_polylepis.1
MARDEVLGRHRAALRAQTEAGSMLYRAWNAHRRLRKERDELIDKVNREWAAQVSQGLVGLMEDWAPAEEDEERLQELEERLQREGGESGADLLQCKGCGHADQQRGQGRPAGQLSDIEK